MDRNQPESDNTVVLSIDCLKGSSKRSGDMLQTGDIVEEIRIASGPGSVIFKAPFKSGKASVQKVLHNSFKNKETSIVVRVRRGSDDFSDLSACIVPNEAAGNIQYVLRSIDDPSYTVEFSDRTESDCLGLQASRGSRMVEALGRAKLQDGFVSYPWERQMQEALPIETFVQKKKALPISGLSNFLSILFLPKASAYGKAGSRYNDLEDTLARANAWLSCSKANGVPIVFMNIQTESLLPKISGETASATVNTTSLSDLSNFANASLYGFEDYHGVDIGVVRAVRLWYAPLGVECPLEIKLRDDDTKLGFSISRTEEGFIYVSSVTDHEDESAPAARSGLSSLYREAVKASRRLVVSRVGNQKVLPWMVSSTGAIRCYDIVSLSQKLSLHRHAKVPIFLHVILWDSSPPRSSGSGTHWLFGNEPLDSVEFSRRASHKRKLDNIAKDSITELHFSDQQNQKQQLQISSPPRPPPLSVHKDSHKFNKPPKHDQVRVVEYMSNEPKIKIIHTNEPKIIHTNEPKIIHTTVSDFMNVVQRLTGINSSADYDVVIRYGKGDISNDDFISHLRAALCRRGLSVSGDSDDEVDAVPECRVLIIILTSTYVPYNLVSLLEHQREETLVVYPLFYKISPPDLISNNKKYESFFIQDEWQVALKEITQMPGYILTDKSESELIDEIVRDALKVLCSNDNKKMIGMDMQIAEILSLLCVESPDIRSIGIWGTVGVGKTAIAEEIFRKISVQYETCVFLKDLHKEVELKGHDAVREDFLSRVLEVEPHVIRISDMKTSFLRSRLHRKRVLVVLDDVNDFRDAETFLGKLSYFGPGSRIIITSRNRRVFVHCKTDHVYEVKPLDVSKSLLLLGRDTFQNVPSTEVFRTLPLEMVKFSNGNPQVLQFCSKSDAALNQSYEGVTKLFQIYKEWQRLSQRIQKTSPIYIPGIFESCIGLDDNERTIFLDIACFFGRMDKDNVAMLLDGCGFSAHVGLRSLVDKSLLTISHNMVDMLSFLRATGREIVRQESPDRPGDRSRLWNSEEIMKIFIDDTGKSAIEGIFLDMSYLKFDANPNAFEKMSNLRLLKFYSSEVVENHGVSFPQGLEYLPSKLRLLHWEYYPLSSLPRSFDPKNLVELNLPNSCANQLWKGKKSLEKLRKMRLSYSYKLTKIPRLSNAPNLEHIDLEGCSSLVSISQSISSLKKLVFLNLKNCSKLESIPSTVDLESLEVLNLSGCSKLETLPEISANVKELYLGGTMIQEIPSSIKNLVSLEKLDLENSKFLVNLPTSICKLKHLETLNLSGCSSLERFPELSRRMKCLKSLDLSRTAIKVLHSSISYMIALEELRFVECKNLVRLPDNAWSLRFKVEFRQIDAEKFSKLWNRFGWLKKAQVS